MMAILVSISAGICELIACSDSAAIRMVLNYGKLSKAIDAVEERVIDLYITFFQRLSDFPTYLF
jgi:hypothetical protein